MNWEIKNLMCDLKILKGKFEDLERIIMARILKIYIYMSQIIP